MYFNLSFYFNKSIYSNLKSILNFNLNKKQILNKTNFFSGQNQNDEIKRRLNFGIQEISNEKPIFSKEIIPEEKKEIIYLTGKPKNNSSENNSKINIDNINSNSIKEIDNLFQGKLVRNKTFDFELNKDEVKISTNNNDTHFNYNINFKIKSSLLENSNTLEIQIFDEKNNFKLNNIL